MSSHLPPPSGAAPASTNGTEQQTKATDLAGTPLELAAATAFQGLEDPWRGALTTAWAAFCLAPQLLPDTLAPAVALMPLGDSRALLAPLEAAVAELLRVASAGAPGMEAVANVHAFSHALLLAWVEATHRAEAARWAGMQQRRKAIVHDFSNAMSAVTGNLDYLKQVAAAAKQHTDQALEDAATSAHLAQDLVGRVGDGLTLEAGVALPLRWTAMDQVVRALRLPPGARVETDAAPTQLLCAQASLVRVVRFLVGKAMAAPTSNGTVLRIQQLGDRLCMSLEDGGPAVDAVGAARLLAGRALETCAGLPEERVDPAGGYLACALVVQAHGGELHLTSPGPTGLRVDLWLPQPAASRAPPGW